jgi:Protein of unknown function (DUF1367)
MTTVVLIRGGDGKLAGMGDKAERAYAKFRRRVDALQPGETLCFSWREPRSPKHHGLFFAKVGALLERQEQFDTEDKLRMWLTVGAGYCDLVPGPKGKPVALPQSIAWDRMEEPEFAELHAAVDAFLWSLHARRFLWPHLSDEQTYELIDQFMLGFSR